MKSGYSPTEVTLGLISMQVELGLETKERLANLAADQQQRYILPPMRMDTRSILKSLGVKFTTAKLQKNSLKSVGKKDLRSLEIKGTTLKQSGKKSERRP